MAQSSDQRGRAGLSIQDSAYYVLHTDYHGTTRQNLRHYLAREVLGYNLHPHIPRISEGAKVADVATGTALWLCEVAREYPGAICEGFDLQLEQAPPAAWLPNNVTLYKWNIYDAPPSDLIERYDIVHVRLISIVIKDGDPTPIVRNLKQLLKPGGWLQWDEIDSHEAHCSHPQPRMQTPYMEQWAVWMQGRTEKIRSREWQHHLPDYLRASGLEKAVMESHASKMEDRMDLAQAYASELLMLTEQAVMRAHGETEEGRRMLDVVANAAKEAKTGAALVLPLVTFLAQKPPVPSRT